jgi:hypothetical protein
MGSQLPLLQRLTPFGRDLLKPLIVNPSLMDLIVVLKLGVLAARRLRDVATMLLAVWFVRLSAWSLKGAK